jgi:PIN domain nuclease of toxin-antitoxin system
VKLLLDTHVLLWWLDDDSRLRARARAAIADPRVTVLVSVASGWELSIKYRLGKNDKLGSAVLNEAVAEGFRLVAITGDHLAALEELPRLTGHGDPFDLLLLAQAQVENATLMTADRMMPSYGVRCMSTG